MHREHALEVLEGDQTGGQHLKPPMGLCRKLILNHLRRARHDRGLCFNDDRSPGVLRTTRRERKLDFLVLINGYAWVFRTQAHQIAQEYQGRYGNLRSIEAGLMQRNEESKIVHSYIVKSGNVLDQTRR